MVIRHIQVVSRIACRRIVLCVPPACCISCTVSGASLVTVASIEGGRAAWATTAHARGGINCTHCHLNAHTGNVWLEKPTHAVCATCHQAESDGFLLGHHGMWLAQGLPPMTPAMARLPMKPDVAQRGIAASGSGVSCATCHMPNKAIVS